MSRAGYSDECDDHWALIRWRGAVSSAIRGARGQAFLREALGVLDAMPEKVLTSGALRSDGAFCVLGAVGAARGLDLGAIDTEDWQALARAFGISEALAREVMFENDEAIDDYMWVDVEICGPMKRPQSHRRSVSVPVARVGELRWHHMHRWIANQILETRA